MTADNLTRGFAAILHGWPADDAALMDRCRALLVDGVACAVGGAGEPGPSLAADVARSQGEGTAATVIAKGFATGEIAAARLNGIAMHVLDFEPMWKPANHALSTTLPAILAASERIERDGASPQGGRLLGALAKGVETQGRLRVASAQYEVGALKFHPPGIVGPLAAAVASSHVLGLDLDRTVAAIGIASSRAAGILGNVGSMTKALHCGDAAAHGLEAALYARRGFTADPDALSGPRGFASAYFGEGFDPSALTAPMTTPRALSPGPAWKLFPTQYATHYAITAALDCGNEIADATRIAAVTARVPVMPYVDRPRPRTGLDGKFSFQYAIAAALLDRRVDVATYADRRRFAPDMEAMLGRIALVLDPAIPGSIDAMHVDLAVTLDDGRVVTRRCDAPIGSWGRPVGREALDRKARGLLEPIVGHRRTEALFDLVNGGSDFSVRDLMRCVASADATQAN